MFLFRSLSRFIIEFHPSARRKVGRRVDWKNIFKGGLGHASDKSFKCKGGIYTGSW